jgi:hypothetical protein
VRDSVTVWKAFAFWSIVDPAVEPLFDGFFAGRFLPLALPSTCDWGLGGFSVFLIGSFVGLKGSCASAMAGFFVVEFLGFVLDGCPRTTNSSPRTTAFFGLPRFFTVSLDMAVVAAPLVQGENGRGILTCLTRSGLSTRLTKACTTYCKITGRPRRLPSGHC